jgi:hypothetical protein
MLPVAYWRSVALAFLATPVLAFIGCGCPGYKITPATGVVTANGQPIAGIEVQFCPEPESGTKGPVSLGETDDQGKFTLRYAEPGATESQEGAVVGWHKVTLADLRQKPAPQGSAPNPSRIPKDYSGVHSTPLKVEIVAGGGPVELKVLAQ